jgi:hypothetical protein
MIMKSMHGGTFDRRTVAEMRRAERNPLTSERRNSTVKDMNEEASTVDSQPLASFFILMSRACARD